MRKLMLLLVNITFYSLCGSASAQQVIPLYTDSIPNTIGIISKTEKPSFTAYLPAQEKRNGCAIIIFPGGAYSFLAFKEEGTNIAEALMQKGITAFVVKYRLPKDGTMKDKSFGPLQDAQQAIKQVRMHAREWKLDTAEIGVMGFSAGGHVASTLGTHFTTSYIPNIEHTNLRPDFMLLMYPVISMDNSLTHRSSRISLLGNGPAMDKVLFFSNEEQVKGNTPPTYLSHTGDDGIVDVDNSIAFYQALQKHGVPVEMHIYPKGNHGFVLREPQEEWMEPIYKWMKNGGWLKDL